MKSVGNLFRQIPEWENLLRATTKALRGKRNRPDARAFVAELDAELGQLGEEIAEGRYLGSGFHQFTIWDPKERVISAPPFRDRVVHHAILNVTESAFESFLIPHSYACRKGKGTLAALQAAQRMARRHREGFWLKMDIRKYFDSIPHEELLRRLGRRFREREMLALWERIIRGYEVNPERGMPIGSLTSQHLANFYLGHVDHLITRRLGCGAYVRFMDDFVVWGEEKGTLQLVGKVVSSFVEEELGLKLKREPILQRVRLGMDYLGMRVFADSLRPSAMTRKRVRAKCARWEWEWRTGRVCDERHRQRMTAVDARLRWPGVRSRAFRERMWRDLENK